MANDGLPKSCEQRGYSQNRLSKGFRAKDEAPAIAGAFFLTLYI
jgi:hypothetical protein